MEENTLVSQIHTIYESIKPSLLKLAMVYRVPNAKVFVDEWQSSAFIIADKFDKGTIERKFTDDDGNLVVCQPGQDIQFLKSFRGYLKTSFRNDLTKNYTQNRRVVLGTPYEMGSADLISSTEGAGLDEILVLINKDVARATKLQHSLADAVTIIFLKALRSAVEELKTEWGDADIIPNIDEKDNDKYFQPEFRQALTGKVTLRLVDEALIAEVPLLFDRLATIALSDMDCAVQKRLYRYLFEYQGGYPARIKKII